MRVEVKKIDIRRGIKCSADRCPIALALHRAFPGALAVKVLPTVAEVRGEYYILPKQVTWFIQDFDDGKRGRPFSFLLRKARPS